MAICEVENERLKVMIDSVGAEIISVIDKKNHREIMWQADEAFWKRHAPILFPNVGKFYNGHYLYNGQHYSIGQHGFARDMQFAVAELEAEQAAFVLQADADTKMLFPFEFELTVRYVLQNNAIAVQWEVKNNDSETMYFTIGGHPAFNVPVLPGTKFTDYALAFEKKQDSLTYLLIDPASGTAVDDKNYELSLTDHRYQLTDTLFDHDALVFDHSQISWAAIAYPDGTPYVAIECPDFTNFGIWSKPGAPFVCLEPWCGRCDNVGFTKDISKKEGINQLEEGYTFRKQYKIIVY